MVEAQKKQYRFFGDHATELEIGDTRPWVGPGDFIDLSSADASDEKIKALIDEGMLVDVVAAQQQAEEAEAEATAAAAAAAAEEEAAQEGTEKTGATATTADVKKGGK